MIYSEVFEATVGASALDQELGKIEVPEGYIAKILELGMMLPADSWVYTYVQEVRVDKIHGSYQTTLDPRIIVDRELSAGQTYKITTSSVTGGATAVLVIYDLSKR